ncbi:Ribose-phosphate pyrophosphokinase 3,Phosphoribosyl pyrophosphate synthase-associated protein 2,Ribose-phosphate pyrophosphokinase 4,Ribose-phosphate pyrophosphokinase 5,Ribose-phosphate pyrophosphokinase,Ribose-phosphate pyrophosphokinase 1,Phosphoribosyl pyrophosphate synthase-associated protein 1,Ribose-phosphate pyrophosphokinase 2,Ribose-phosphate pyrophosphokinase A [Lepeophtheirus salmonis]|uniref:Ribose-phosphate pyrophosphokinase N-terminal domain-containing protein n=1 Tax=Lepeophtheirus salmonis TaxID=72036 RepID=A0A7R8CYW5_LEPSM|nr:Ribose-phosphate pyrophosphokinase 3,Phosphoribosyl pyrophosphate synthase-associated protein 2,Ribose-phosphate pyrophosphokinase 4,Ribose-phosphate pyrophosphokinase 5,Ribose-phosphate pyrophosphokinase,Ribose-phosphate pyrophosphokinase 1,Phosphoribosyl pyrophosphate synthase-associated protein 1,Ribose-phosphate pyrophosphokinase 2,Ribose-phosphate pyrophosphokinase A [Lepeophtheirus salmonis]CAF2972179.1 Ribose-phosphate pyrophosphokinase 3,Phosphoribosyl pyrophosphate synthase-associated 
MNLNRLNIFCILLKLLCASATGPISCRSPEGTPLDWFILYKIPSLPSPENNLRNGSSFAWIHSDLDSWERNPNLSILVPEDSAVGITLDPAFQNTFDTLRIFYNDEVPQLNHYSEKGHTKGVLFMDATSGFWLIHSAPKFPNSPDKYRYPHTALRYGQSFLCISFNTTLSINELSLQLMYDDISIYFPPHSLPPWTSRYPHLLDLLQGRRKQNVRPPFSRTVVLSSLFHTLPFISFAKGPRFKRDLYANLVAPSLRTSLLVETWAHGSGGRLNTTCSDVPYPIYNVKLLKLMGIPFHRMEDHSKWAIGGGYVCVGDINRMTSQRKRGGGTLCFRNSKAYKLFADLIVETEPSKRHGVRLGNSSVYHNTNRETMVEIQESVRGKDVYIIQTGSRDVNNTIMELLIMCYACKTSSCNKVIGVIPYMPYSQQTKMRRRGNISLKLFAEMLTKAGFDHIITVDLHSKESQGFFDCVVDNLRASPFLIKYITESIPDYRNAVIVAKNPLAARRATSYADRLRLAIAVIHGEVKESEDLDGRASPPPTFRGRVLSVVGDVGGKIAIMVDDMIDDVQSFVDAAIVLKERGAYKIYALATHGVLSADAPRLIEESPIDEVVVTNTVPHDSKKLQCHKIKTVDISILLAEAIRRIHNKESMSHLFRHVTLED